MHVTSYDWLNPTAADAAAAAAGKVPYPPPQQPSASTSAPPAAGDGGSAQHGTPPPCSLPRAARVVLDHTLRAEDPPAVLFPRAGGNIHEFTALTDCAVLDLMSPPYSTGVWVVCGGGVRVVWV